MHRVIRAAAAVLLLGACAHMATPPGGPTDTASPILIAVYPDSVRVLEGFRGFAEFRFNEVVSEESAPNFGRGTGDLEKRILLSPDTLVPRVLWRRNRILVQPHNGWQPNTVYRIELLPGIRDLSQNQLKTPRAITFATGGAVPNRVLVGRAIDWTSNRSSPLALIEAMHLPDRLVYRTLTDSLGRFHLESLPEGQYLVSGIIDRNGDHRRGRDELWDSVRVPPGGNEVGEIWMFPRDSAAPRFENATKVDSNWAAITISQPLDPKFVVRTDSMRVVQLPDSSSIGPRFSVSQAKYDSMTPKPVPKPVPVDTATVDSLGRPRVPPVVTPPVAASKPDSVRPDTPSEKRPILNTKLYVSTTGTFVAGKKYYIEVRGVRAAGGAIGTVRGVLTVPEVKTAPVTKPDSSKAKPDSSKTKPDSSRTGRGGGGGGGG